MLELPHTLVGAAIATKIAQPQLAIPLAFMSHFLIDFIPHWNPSFYTETKKYNKPTRKSTIIVALDAFLSLMAGLWVSYLFLPDINRAIIILFACFAAVASDVIEGFYFFLGIRPKFLQRWVEFQHHHQGRTKPLPGLIIQAATVLLCFYLILSSRIPWISIHG